MGIESADTALQLNLALEDLYTYERKQEKKNTEILICCIRR